MAERSASRRRAGERSRSRERAPGLSHAQALAVQSFVLRLPAQLLETGLKRVQAELPPDEDEDWEEAAEDGPDEVFESADWEDAERDWEGDRTEEVRDASPFDPSEVDEPRDAPDRFDVLIEPLPAQDGVICFVVRSGLSDLLWTLGGANPLAFAYRMALRARIAATVKIARFLLANGALSPEDKGIPSRRARRDTVREATGLEEGALSRLLSEGTARMPDGSARLLADCFEEYSADETTDRALVQALAESADRDRRAAESKRPGVKRKALTDAELAAMVNAILTESGVGRPVSMAAVRAARAERLGLPASNRRPEQYAEGRSLFAMAAESPAESPKALAERLERWNRLTEPLLLHPNAATRNTVQRWWEEMEAIQGS